MHRTISVATTLLASTVLLAGIALAHTSKFVSSTPFPGQTLSSSPAAVVITYDEELKTGSTGTVTDPAGARVDTGATILASDHYKLSIALRPSLANAVYKVTWHSVSHDNETLDGSFFFGVGVSAPSTSTDPGPGSLPLILVAAGLLLVVSSLRLSDQRRAGP